MDLFAAGQDRSGRLSFAEIRLLSEHTDGVAMTHTEYMQVAEAVGIDPGAQRLRPSCVLSCLLGWLAGWARACVRAWLRACMAGWLAS